MSRPTLIERITATEPTVRDLGLAEAIAGWSEADLLGAADDLERFRKRTDNLYERVRALCFLQAIYRFHLPPLLATTQAARIPAEVHRYLWSRRYEEALDHAQQATQANGTSDALCSALAAIYHGLMFQTLADQVRVSVRTQRGNGWMFRVGHPFDHPLRLVPALRTPRPDGSYPILTERTSVRLDPSHSGWSDIFFLAMDAPEAAQVLNISVALGVHGRDPEPVAPIECYLRIIDEPVLRLVSVDLGAQTDIDRLDHVFDYARDHLGLLKAAVLAAGLVAPGLEGYRPGRAGQAHDRGAGGTALRTLLAGLTGADGLGIEIVSRVRDIPKGSRLAVSTNLLGSLIALCMRATGQTASTTGQLREVERRLAAARAILGEWLGGSGGGWQDSGGLWPGIKRIAGAAPSEGDPECGVSRGRLLPEHTILDDIPATSREALQDSLLLVHGGMAQNVGPVLEMVTERYLLREATATEARRESLATTQRIEAALRAGDMRALGQATLAHFRGPLQRIVPWASNAFAERLIDELATEYGADFHGFLMLGGMAGGGMGLFFTPSVRRAPQTPPRVQQILAKVQGEFADGLAFAMPPVVYDFRIDDEGTTARWLQDHESMPAEYYAMVTPALLRRAPRELSARRRAELGAFGTRWRTHPELAWIGPHLLDELLPTATSGEDADTESLDAWLRERGFDAEQHESVRQDLISGRLGLAQNRLPPTTTIEDVRDGDIAHHRSLGGDDDTRGRELLAEGAVAVVTLAAGAASRWTRGAGVIKSLDPFVRLPLNAPTGRHRRFVDIHVAKTRQSSQQCGARLTHVFTTSPFTDPALRRWQTSVEDPAVDVVLSPGQSLGLRMVPTVRDLRFAWEELPQQTLDEQAQKVRDSERAALIQWAADGGEATDYRDNLAQQCVHPIGHWFEVPNLLRNGTLHRLLQQSPGLRYLLLHNVDTLGAWLDPKLLGWHARSGNALGFEVIPRRVDDLGGGLARVDSRLRLVEGLALPRPEDEFLLSYYNTLTTWIDIDQLLAAFQLERADLADSPTVHGAIRQLGERLPTYITLKDVKKRWGHGQEDVFPVSQFEKLWGDMTALPELACGFVSVDRTRGQQLKDPANLDQMLRDGSLDALSSICAWPGSV